MMASKTAAALWKKLASVLTISLALWLVGDADFSVFSALQQHEPSERIFRSLLQVNLILFGTALSLYVWTRIVGVSLIHQLLFQPVVSTLDGRIYHSVLSNDDDELNGNDAHYESDGEVDEQQQQQAQQPRIPSPSSVLSAALDMLLIIMIALFFFTITAAGLTTDWRLVAQIAAPTFPLLLFCYMAVQLVLPWRKRSEFLIILSLTTTAPWHPVTFRDGMIGDILTSAVRPLQDLSFTVFYLLCGLRGWWSQDYYFNYNVNKLIDQADASVPEIEKSWLVHTLVLPMCMLSPLWWRFLQNLRQSLDNKARWPYLGNALKYFCAAQVAVVGVFYPEYQGTPVWLASFVMATLYQVWWDVVMDWGLLERQDSSSGGGWWKYQLRTRRLYPTWCYYAMCVVNFLLRFCWTLSFLPGKYLSASGVLMLSPATFMFVLGPFIASAEIVRRTLWGLLRFEWEALRHLPDEEGSNSKQQPVEEGGEGGTIELIPATTKLDDLKPQQQLSSKHQPLITPMSSMNDVQILGELSLYATVFCLLGCLAAAHRGTF